jgi:hypothetical protein
MKGVIVVDKKALLAQPELKIQLALMAGQLCEVNETYQFLPSGEYDGAFTKALEAHHVPYRVMMGEEVGDE